MKFLALAAVVATACAHYVPVTRFGRAHETIKGEYIVKFKSDAAAEFQQFQTRRSFLNAHVNQFSNYMGFSGALTEAQLEEVQQMPGVESIEPNGMVYALGEQTGVQAWGIDRSDQRALPLDAIYRWNDAADGTGVRIFILDTGIDTTHEDFNGRAQFDADCTPVAGCNTAVDSSDPQGHGTHCAGSAASTTYGIAKNSTVHNVRCLNAQGSGSFAGIINAIEFVVNAGGDTRIISMSLGGGRNTALNAAVDAAYDGGVLSVIAAGNFNNDACTQSPASADRAFTIAASDISDVKASFSSHGACVDLYAPGVNILSTRSGGGTAIFSGTSMSTPHVAGAAALVASRGITSPEEIARTLLSEATPDVIVGNVGATPNLLLFTPPQ